ncbi:MAG: DHH family phosphoesterase, partial [Negativicutes bacterium]|nr:DHH family phosphoesterase [Negativicutes bacterium]
IERQIMNEAEQILAGQDGGNQRVLVIAGENWHGGVIGIVASRLAAKYYRPVVMLTRQEDGSGKGSCRSIEGVDIYAALSATSSLLKRFGGHPQAAGLTIDWDNVGPFRRAINEHTVNCYPEQVFVARLTVDCQIGLDEIDDRFMSQLLSLEPFGAGNPRPLFVSRQLIVNEVRTVGHNRHLFLKLGQEDREFTAINWGGGEFAARLSRGRPLDVVYSCEYQMWRDKREIRLNVADLAADDSADKGATNYDKVVKGSLTIIDGRQADDELFYLLDVCRRATGSVTVVVPGRDQAVELSAAIRQRAGRIDVVVAGNGDWTPRPAKIEIFTGITDRLPGNETLLMAVPDSPSAWQRWQKDIACNVERLHLLWTPAIIAGSRQRWQAKVPQRADLELLFRVLRTCSVGQGSFEVEEKLLINRMTCSAGRVISRSLVYIGLQIFREIGLVSLVRRKTVWQITWSDYRCRKFELEHSALYRQGLENFAAAELHYSCLGGYRLPQLVEYGS